VTLPKELEALPDNILDAIHGAFFGCDVGGGPINAAADAVLALVSPLLAEKDAEIARLTEHAKLHVAMLAADLSAEIAARETAEARVAELEAALADPNAIHLMMLRGVIAKPSVDQIKHIYPGIAATARNDALEEAAKVARDGCLVPPDGGSPTEAEADMCARIAFNIRILKGDTTHAAE